MGNKKTVKAEIIPEWIEKKNSPYDAPDNDWLSIERFYVYNAAVDKLSARGGTLEALYGWGTTESKFQDYSVLKKRLISCLTAANSEMIRAESFDEMGACLIDMRLEPFPQLPNRERCLFKVVNNRGFCESLLYHIRNAIAHGRAAINIIGKQKVVLLEDIDSRQNVTARMILRQDTLIDWQTIISAGPRKSDEAIYEKLRCSKYGSGSLRCL